MRWFAVLMVAFCLPGVVQAQESLLKVKSAHSVKATLDRLETGLKEKGVNIVARIDHAAAAEKAGMTLRPTEVLMFGNPKAGTPMMLCEQSIGIDLPQKALAWQDEKGDVWLAYNDQKYLAQRHGAKGCDAPVTANSEALAAFVKVAVQP